MDDMGSSWTLNETGTVKEVHPALREIFPNGLRSEIHSLTGISSVAFGLMTSGWCGIAGLSHLGMEAANHWGVNLERLVLIPNPEPWLETIATLIEGLDVVLTSVPSPLSAHTVQRLLSRLRVHGCTLIVLGDLVGAQTRIHAETTGWEGLGAGHGYLAGQQMEIKVRSRHLTRTVTVVRNENGISRLC